MNKSGGVECLAWTWGVAALIGLFLATLLWTLGGWTFMQGAFMGVLALLVVGAVLTIMMCRAPASGPVRASAGAKGTGATAYAASGVVSKSTPSTDTAAADASAAATAKAATDADRAASDAATKSATDAAASKAAAAKAAKAAAKADADRAAAAATAAAATPTAAASASPVAVEPAAGLGGSRPAALDGPRGGTADDLKRIKGVGPKMEIMCNELGFYHFDQIAAWSADEVSWVDQNLKGFKGRVTRDTWVDQARLLAAGEETEFSKKVDGGTVY